MKIALVHDDLIQFGGAERLLLALHEIWPQAPVYTSVASKKWLKVCKELKIDLKTSFMQRLPFAAKLNRFYSVLLLHTLAFESFDLNSFDLVISVSARYSHGIITKPQTRHICYMNSPGRMIWEPSAYFKNEKIVNSAIKKAALFIVSLATSQLRLWDFASAHRIDKIVANSRTPQQRIKKYYGRDSKIIYPFVDTEKFKSIPRKGSYYLIISRLLAWKRIDVAIKACNQLNLPLKIIGEGPALDELKKVAGPKTEFLGFVSEEQKIKYLSNCIALINTQYEDFGIVPLEAMAAGKPVIAYQKGGVLETVVPEKTGVYFTEQSPESLSEVLKKFDPVQYQPVECQAQAKKFSKQVFVQQIKEMVYT